MYKSQFEFDGNSSHTVLNFNFKLMLDEMNSSIFCTGVK